MKIDLHCHSKHSKRPSLWLMKKLGCPESFTEPESLYRKALAKGMTAATITDHNVIDGALEIAHHPNTMLGCEYTTYFPEDRCKIHILAWGFTESHHKDLSVARENIYDFTDYLIAEGIQHACAHPLYGPNDILSIEHIEKLALLYRYWEWNGDMNQGMNYAVDFLIRNTTREHILFLADKHNVAPRGEVWNKIMTAGSDDHSSLNLTRCYTEVPGADNFTEFWAGLHAGQAQVHCRDATPEMFARNIYGIAYQFYKTKFDLDRYTPFDPVLQFANHHLCGNSPKVAESRFVGIQKLFLRRKKRNAPANHGNLVELLRNEAREILEADPKIMRMLRVLGENNEEALDKRWFDFVNALSNKVLLHLGNRMIERLNSHQLFDLFHTLGSAGALYTVLAPYFATYSLHAQNKAFAVTVLDQFANGQLAPKREKAEARVAHFTDTYFEFNGVSRTLQQQCKAAKRLEKDYTVLACADSEQSEESGLRTFKGEGRFALPEYAEIQLLAPPLLKILEHCYETEYTHIHISTPGPMGLAGLAVARILCLPVSGTYHTSFPQYGKVMTEDSHVEEVLWRLMIWFYEQMDTIYVPSSATASELEERGMNAKKIKVYPRGVDCQRFHPDKRNGAIRQKYGIPISAPLFLYVGRVSEEKNLATLVEAFKSVRLSIPQALLLVVGDGPYRNTMESLLTGQGAVFTGYLDGNDLAIAYADSDVLVFPSLSDTFGNVVLEAQASGVPAIVGGQGGPQENILHGKTGLAINPLDAASLAEAMLCLLENKNLHAEMRANARAYMEERGFDQAFMRLWTMWTNDTVKSGDTHHASFTGLNLESLARMAS